MMAVATTALVCAVLWILYDLVPWQETTAWLLGEGPEDDAGGQG